MLLGCLCCLALILLQNRTRCSGHRGAAKAGKTVLHLDQAGHYGSAWTSLTLDDFLIWAQQQPSTAGLAKDRQSPGKQGAAGDTGEDTAEATDLVHIRIDNDQDSMYSNMQLHQQSIALGSSRNFSLDLAGKARYLDVL